MPRMARIKEGEDVIALSRREGFHGGDGMVQVVVVTCLAWLNDHMTCMLCLEPNMSQ